MAVLYTAADALVLCSRQDNFPTVCLEAAACGTPVVGFSVGGVAETILPGLGTAVSSGDIPSMQRALLELPSPLPAAVERARVCGTAKEWQKTIWRFTEPSPVRRSYETPSQNLGAPDAAAPCFSSAWEPGTGPGSFPPARGPLPLALWGLRDGLFPGLRSCFCFSPSSMLWPTLTMRPLPAGLRLYLLGPWVFYRLGKAYALHTGSCSGFCQLLAAPSLGMWLHGLLNWLARLRWQEALPAQNRCGLLAGEPVSVTCTGMLLTAAAALALGRLCSPERPPANGPPSSVWGAAWQESAYFANRTLPLLCALLLAAQAWKIASAPHRGPSSPPVCRNPLCPPLPGPGPPETLWGLGSWLSPLPLTRRPLNPGEGLSRLEIWSAFFRGGRWLRFP